MITRQIKFWGAVTSILGFFLSLYLYFGTADDSTQPHQGNGIEVNSASNTPAPPENGKDQKLIEDLTKDLTLDGLETDFSLINRMRYKSNKDAGLMVLIKKALNAEKYDFTSKAIEFALAMSFSSNRDNALRMIVDKALSQGHKDIAIRASDEFRFSSNADAARQKIIEYSNSSATQNLPAKRP